MMENKKEFKRPFTPQELVEAYESTGIKPVTGIFYNDNFTCACGLSTMYAYRNPDKGLRGLKDSICSLNEMLGGEPNRDDLIMAFYQGFDSPERYNLNDLKEGYNFEIIRFGIECREAVEKSFGKLD